jgi:membrane associated rhomboid family serine protease
MFRSEITPVSARPSELGRLGPSLKNCIRIVALFVACLWLIKLSEWFFSFSLVPWSLVPRDPGQLQGILFAPLIHGGFQHLISNSLPLLLLGTALLYGYPKARWWSLLIIWLLSGVGVWLFARESFHFGASGLTHGLFFFLFVSGFLRRDKKSIALLFIAFFMYGGMLLSVFPNDPGISFEYHGFGALAGVLCAYLFRRSDLPAKKRYSWDIDPNSDEENMIGEEWRRDD